jgi:hypothetical protein
MRIYRQHSFMLGELLKYMFSALLLQSGALNAYHLLSDLTRRRGF